MKCPYRRTISKSKDYVLDIRYLTVEYKECYEDDCPYYDMFKQICRKVEKEVEKQND